MWNLLFQFTRIIFTIIDIIANVLNIQLTYIGHSLFIWLSFINLYTSIPISISMNNKYLIGFISPDKH